MRRECSSQSVRSNSRSFPLSPPFRSTEIRRTARDARLHYGLLDTPGVGVGSDGVKDREIVGKRVSAV